MTKSPLSMVLLWKAASRRGRRLALVLALLLVITPANGSKHAARPMASSLAAAAGLGAVAGMIYAASFYGLQVVFQGRPYCFVDLCNKVAVGAAAGAVASVVIFAAAGFALSTGFTISAAVQTTVGNGLSGLLTLLEDSGSPFSVDQITQIFDFMRGVAEAFVCNSLDSLCDLDNFALLHLPVCIFDRGPDILQGIMADLEQFDFQSILGLSGDPGYVDAVIVTQLFLADSSGMATSVVPLFHTVVPTVRFVLYTPCPHVSIKWGLVDPYDATSFHPLGDIEFFDGSSVALGGSEFVVETPPMTGAEIRAAMNSLGFLEDNAYLGARVIAHFVSGDVLSQVGDPLFTAVAVTVSQAAATERPNASITDILPNPASQSQDETIVFAGNGEDPDEPGDPNAITTYRWDSNVGKTDGSTELYDGPNSSFSMPASMLVAVDHIITLRVKDNDDEWSEPVEAPLTIIPGSPGDLVVHSPTQANPVTVPPGGFYCAEVSWDLTTVPGFNPAVGVEVQLAVDTGTGGWHISLGEEPFFNATQSHLLRCGLGVSGSCIGPRDFRVQIRDAATSEMLVQAVELDAINCADTPVADFSLSPFPNSVPASSPSSAQFSIIAEYSNGFSAPVTLSIPSGLPQNVSASFAPNPLVPPATTGTLSLDRVNPFSS